MIQDIDIHITLIENSMLWAKKYSKDSFPFEVFKEYRRKLKKVRSALEEKCSAAAYGESQVGKSYLMSSLLSSPESPFVITSGDKSYNFIDELNPSGGNNAKVESTGVITRFTISNEGEAMPNRVKVRNLSVVDVILLIADSYYNDIKINPETALKYDEINKELESMSSIWGLKVVQQHEIHEDDIKDICDYIKEIIGNNASSIYQSNFCKIVAPIIQYVSFDKWVDIFSLLWNRNREMSHLFSTLINEYKKINFLTEVYVPFDAVLRSKGTLLKIEWLDCVCGIKPATGSDEIYTDVYDAQGHIVARDFGKGNLSALISELTFSLPKELASDRRFLNKMDLLDFPGTRSREKYKEQEIQTVLPKILRRGKVAYLFNKYSRSLRISSVLFCHHNDQKTEPTIGETINSWIEDNIGHSPEQRASMLTNTSGIAPLFLIATKFNIDLERTKTDSPSNVDKIDTHWNRFETVFPEIIKPNQWLEQWVIQGGQFRKPYFQNIYPLRDFYWSGKNGLFDGYSDGEKKSSEKSVHHHMDYPGYMDNLKNSFLNNEFVRKHFEDPKQTWDDVATLNNDGSKAIIRNLDKIAGVLDEARRKKYVEQLRSIKKELYNNLLVYFEPEDNEAKNRKVRKISGDIKRSLYLSVGEQPEVFGKIIDKLMVSSGDLRNIAYDVIVCRTETPTDFSGVTFLRKTIGIDPADDREVNIKKLCAWGHCDVEQLEKDFAKKGFTVDDVIVNKNEDLTTVAGVVTKNIIEFWRSYVNSQAKELLEYLPHADEVVFMLLNLLDKLEIKKIISNKIHIYSNIFDEDGLPNAIANYASLILNNFVSNVGREYIEDSELQNVYSKAKACNLDISLSSNGYAVVRKPQSLLSTLSAFDDSADIDSVDVDLLRKLPLWGSFQRWENLVTIGLLYASDISYGDPVANGALKNLMIQCEALYNQK